MTKTKIAVLFGITLLIFLHVAKVDKFMYLALASSFNSRSVNIEVKELQLSNIGIDRRDDSLLAGSSITDDPIIIANLNTQVRVTQIMLDIETNEPGMIQIFYLDNYMNSYSEQRSLRIPVHSGQNHLQVKVPVIERAVWRSIRIDPADSANVSFKISNIKVVGS